MLTETVLDLKVDALHNENAMLYHQVRKVMEGGLRPIWFTLSFLDRPWNPFRKEYFDALNEYHEILRLKIEEKKQEVLGFNKETDLSKKDLLTSLITANSDEAGENQMTTKELQVSNFQPFGYNYIILIG